MLTPRTFRACLSLMAAIALAPSSLLAQSHPFDRCCDPLISPALKAGGRDWVTGTGVSLGGVLFPHFHFESIYGGSTADPETLAVGHHDPDRQGLTISNIDFGASLRTGQHLEAFVAYAAKVDLDDDWRGEFEEWFAKLKDLPGGFEVRGGQYYNRFGIQNTFHPHDFDWADQYLVNGRFLGEDGLGSIGGEVGWFLPVKWTSLLNVSVGVPPAQEEEAHAEPEEEPEFEAEGATFDDVITVLNWTNLYDWNDFHQFRAGLSGAWGDNLWGDNLWGGSTAIYGAHLQYEWRENGYEASSSFLRWRTEAMLRRFDALSGHLPGEEPAEEHDEEPEEKTRHRSLNEAGLYTSALYGLDNGLEFGLRGEFVEGIAAAGLDQRFRASPSVGCSLNKARTIKLRVQYNYDHSDAFGGEHSVWAQFRFAWGGPEVR